MPDWLEPIARKNPFTTMVAAARSLFLGTAAGNAVWARSPGASRSSPLAAWRYRRAVLR